MNIDIANKVEEKYRELSVYYDKSKEFENLYISFENIQIRQILACLHYSLNGILRIINTHLPNNTTHFLSATETQFLADVINEIQNFQLLLNSTEYRFQVDGYYLGKIEAIKKWEALGERYAIPKKTPKIDLYLIKPVFSLTESIGVDREYGKNYYSLKMIGNGSYAKVYKFRDDYYNCQFAVKEAFKDIKPKELERFYKEYEVMKSLNSIHVLKVYNLDREKNRYIMELMDCSLLDYVRTNDLSYENRIQIVLQILDGFCYIHEKGLLHRDINPSNILVKKYDDDIVVKISDFGLVKEPGSTLTSIKTDFKGNYNDPLLEIMGFSNYQIKHEVFSLTRVILFVMTGKPTIEGIENPDFRSFIEKGINPDLNMRFESVLEMKAAFKEIIKSC